MSQVDSKTLALSRCATVIVVLAMAFVFFLATLTGCKQEFSKSLWVPAPLSKIPPPYEVVGRVHYAWGDSVKIGRIKDDVRELHQCILIGVETPKPGQRFHRTAQKASLKLFQRKMVVFKVARVDDMKFECGLMFHSEEEGKEPVDIGIKLIEMGLAWYDGEEFEGSDLYVQAEQKAREQKLGLWGDNSPLPPWEFHEQQQKNLRERMSKLKLDGSQKSDGSQK